MRGKGSLIRRRPVVYLKWKYEDILLTRQPPRAFDSIYWGVPYSQTQLNKRRVHLQKKTRRRQYEIVCRNHRADPMLLSASLHLIVLARCVRENRHDEIRTQRWLVASQRLNILNKVKRCMRGIRTRTITDCSRKRKKGEQTHAHIQT